MSETEKVDVQFHFQRRGKNKVLVEGKEPPKPVKPKGRFRNNQQWAHETLLMKRQISLTTLDRSKFDTLGSS